MTRLVASLPSTFLGFIAAGVGVILTFSLWSTGPPGAFRHWTMTAVVVGLMVAYGVFLWIRSRTAYAAETDGETFYYLGFIYTLATLVATFAPLLSSPERPESRHVLGLFGLGLITTFVGLAGRIVFAQTAPGLARPEDEARRLAEAYTEAAHAIERSTVRIVHAQRRAEGHLSESYTGAAEALRAATEQITGIVATLGDLRAHLGDANRAWAEVAGVTDGTRKSLVRAGAALSSLEQGTRAAEQSVLDWSGGLTKAGAGLHALTEMTERAVQLGQDAVATQAQLAAQIAGPLTDQLRRHSEAAGALASRLQEDLRASEEAMRRVHHHLIDASRFILSKVG